MNKKHEIVFLSSIELSISIALRVLGLEGCVDRSDSIKDRSEYSIKNYSLNLFSCKILIGRKLIYITLHRIFCFMTWENAMQIVDLF